MTALHGLAKAGVSVWLDDLGRHRIDSGELARLVEQVGVVGVTTNPSIFAAAVRDGTDYEQQLASASGDTSSTLHQLMVADVSDACRILTPAFSASAARDGRVSFEVDPRLAYDTDATVRAAAEIWRDIGRPNLMVKIPATEAGLPAITQTLAAGISVNVTLIFGIERYRQVQQAWLTGLEQAVANGVDISQVASVASFFVSRLDTSVDRRLDALTANGQISTEQQQALRGRAAVANARNAYRMFERARSEERWSALETAGAIPQRPLWASTSTKDPTFPVTRYVDELVAPDTVNTMPAHTLDAVLARDSSDVWPRTIDAGTAADDAQLFTELAQVGIDYDDVVAELESAGVQSFIDAWEALLDLVESARHQATG
jgi:transaldolase